MTTLASKFSIQAFSLVFAAGMLFFPATAKADQGMSSQSPVGSGSDISVPEVQDHLSSGVDTQWSD